ncbi:MAG: hypothetical protein FRX49_02827 [Trebouxia sp. A1-2]|nr:MAG: hypothetical protein FRX49_02827 [Trebouxia sp. A1-2]
MVKVLLPSKLVVLESNKLQYLQPQGPMNGDLLLKAKAALQAKYNADINAQLAAIAQQQKDTNKAVINSSRPRLPSAQLQICRGRKTKGILSFRAY